MREIENIPLSELLTSHEIDAVGVFIANRDSEGLRSYLNERKAALRAKGVLPDYLYYWLCYQYELG